MQTVKGYNIFGNTGPLLGTLGANTTIFAIRHDYMINQLL